MAVAFGDLATALDSCERAGRGAQDEARARGFGCGSDWAGEPDSGMLPLDLGGGAPALELARSAVLSAKQQACLDEQVTSWTTTLTELRSAVQAPDLAGLHPEQADEAQGAAELAPAALSRALEARAQARGARDASGPAAGRVH